MGRRLPRSERASGERGSALVEAAFVIPVLLMIVFGTIEFGVAYKNSLSVSSATRAGARTASAMPKDPTFASGTMQAVGKVLSALPATAPQELWIYEDTGAGRPASCATDCVRYSNWDAANARFTAVTDNWPASRRDACAGPSIDSVGIWVRAEHRFVTGLFGTTKSLTNTIVMRLEPIPQVNGCSGI